MKTGPDSDSVPRLVPSRRDVLRRGRDLERFLNLWRLGLLAGMTVLLLASWIASGSLPPEQQWALGVVALYLAVSFAFQLYLAWFPWQDSFAVAVVLTDLVVVTGLLLGFVAVDRAIVATNSQISFFGYFMLVALAGVRSNQQVARSVAVTVPLSYTLVVFLAVAWREVPFSAPDPLFGSFQWHSQAGKLLMLSVVTWVIHQEAALRSSDRALAQHDPLTGLLNRRYLEEFLGRELPRARRLSEHLSLLLLDLDGFKEYNDIHGHLAGDRMLAKVGTSLSAALRSCDVLVRFGGDEFVVVLPDTPGELARRVARDLLLATPPEIGVSVGVACLGEGVETAEELLGAADAALMRAKQSGRGAVRAG